MQLNSLMCLVKEEYFGYVRGKCSVKSQDRREKMRKAQLDNIPYVVGRKKTAKKSI